MENKTYTVIVREYCLASFENHLDFISNVSLDAAEDLHLAFWDVADALVVFPERNPLVHIASNPGVPYRRALLGKHHAVLYEISGATVYVDIVVDLRQDIGINLL